MKFKEEMLNSYAAPPSATEESRCKNAISMVRDALKGSDFTDENKEIKALFEGTSSYGVEMKSKSTGRKIKIFVQGSYANGTNVRQNSDVDIAIILESTFKTKYRYGVGDINYGFSTASYGFKEFKNDVQKALTKIFTSDVERGDKSVKINGNGYRVDTDTVPALRYRDYTNDYLNNESNYIGAISIYSDSTGEEIINYPEQHIQNGRKKNVDTNFYYKKMVRIAKKIRYLMQDNYISSANKVSSFGIESLLWNIPNSYFTKYSTHKYIFDDIVNYLADSQYLNSFKEANGIKPLFSTERNINDYIHFINDLRSFYSYE